jgi:hypothetical protein
MRKFAAAALLWTVAGTVIGAVAGCSAPQPYGPGRYDPLALSQETFTVNGPGAVLGMPAAAAPPVSEAWWLARRDEALNVEDGTATDELNVYVVQVEDRQWSSGDVQRDYVRRRVFSTRQGMIAR